jgi:Ca2+-binding EF-hand superfamily protein
LDSYTPSKMTEMKELFDIYDKDGNGVLDREELMAGFKNVFENYEELDKMIGKYDKNHDALINFNEFLHLMKPVRISDPFAYIRNS